MVECSNTQKSAHPLFDGLVRCSTHGPSFVRLQYWKQDFSVSATQLTPIAGHNFSLSWSLATDEAIWVAMQAADVIMQQNSYSIHVWAVCHNVDTKPAALGIDTNIWCIATNAIFCIYPQRILLISQQQLSCTLFPTPVLACRDGILLTMFGCLFGIPSLYMYLFI